MNTIQDRIPPIVAMPLEVKLSASNKTAIKTALAKLEDLTLRGRTVNTTALYNHYKETLSRFAAGTATLDQALALSVLTGTSDADRTRIAQGLQQALHSEELATLKEVSPAIIDAFTQRTEALRLKSAAIEVSERENAEACGIPFEASETCKRVHATFLHNLERLRAIRDKAELPSKAELKELAAA
jgi:hypothetical protein